MKKRYDLIVALGGGRDCAEALELAGMRFLTFPFDELEGVPLAERLEQARSAPADSSAAFAAMDRHLRSSQTVLLVWADVPGGLSASDADCLQALDVFRSRWSGAAFEIVALRQRDGARLGDYRIEEKGALRTVAFDYHRRDASRGCDPRLLAGLLRHDYQVADYRTPEEKEAFERERVERVGRNLAAMNCVARGYAKFQIALFGRLKSHLTRLGVIER